MAAVLTLLACASQGAPPGGPEDHEPPKLIAVVPESGAVNATPRRVEFRFDEVIQQQPSGVPSLAGLVLLSPSDGAPRVSWARRAITVRPRGDWRPNTAYTITLLPGVSDLRGNVQRMGRRAVFSTGPTIPATRIAGALFDWVQGTPVRGALIEAIALPDSTRHFAAADSLGAFVVAHVTPGTYHVRGWSDANQNRDLDPREPFDSTTITLRDTARVELLAFLHDTIPPRINAVDVADSVTLRVELDKPLDPRQRLDTSLFILKAADSSVVPLRRVVSAAEAAAADTAAPRDTVARPRPSRPSPVSRIVVTVGRALAPATAYRLEGRDLRNLLGFAGRSARAFTTPPRATPAPAPGDTVRRRPP